MSEWGECGMLIGGEEGRGLKDKSRVDRTVEYTE